MVNFTVCVFYCNKKKLPKVDFSLDLAGQGALYQSFHISVHQLPFLYIEENSNISSMKHSKHPGSWLLSSQLHSIQLGN